jgi:diacylglycerol kinase family enzyme
VFVIFNPTAGRRRTHLLWRVLDVLVSHGVRVELAETSHPGHAECLAREAVARNERLVVAAGGDGTIAEVATGLLGGDAALGVIPLGTANVLAQELALPFAPKAVATALAFGRTTKIWPGIAETATGRRLFVQMLGLGFDAHVVRNVTPGMKKLLGKGAYVLTAATELTRYRFPRISVRLDGAETTAASIIVSKGRLYGGSYHLTSEATPGEPGFSVVLFDWGGPGAAAVYGIALPLNVLERLPGVRRIRAHRVDFQDQPPVPAQTDGDFAGAHILSATDADRAIDVIVG